MRHNRRLISLAAAAFVTPVAVALAFVFAIAAPLAAQDATTAPKLTPWATSVRSVDTLAIGVAGPGHAPERWRSADMYAWASLELAKGRAMLPALEWVILRNPVGQVEPSPFLPPMVAGDFGGEAGAWLPRFVDHCHEAGLRVALYAHSAEVVNVGTFAEPVLEPIDGCNRATALAGVRSVMQYSGADRFVFDAWRGAPVDHRAWLAERLDESGIEVGVEAIPGVPLDESYATVDALVQLTGNLPRGVWDNDPDRPAGDTRDRPTVNQSLVRVLEHKLGDRDLDLTLWLDRTSWTGSPPDLRHAPGGTGVAVTNWIVDDWLRSMELIPGTEYVFGRVDTHRRAGVEVRR